MVDGPELPAIGIVFDHCLPSAHISLAVQVHRYGEWIVLGVVRNGIARSPKETANGSVLDRGEIGEGTVRLARRAGHINVAGRVDRERPSHVKRVTGAIVAGEPDLISVRVEFGRRIIKTPTGSGEGASHEDIA